MYILLHLSIYIEYLLATFPQIVVKNGYSTPSNYLWAAPNVQL